MTCIVDYWNAKYYAIILNLICKNFNSVPLANFGWAWCKELINHGPLYMCTSSGGQMGNSPVACVQYMSRQTIKWFSAILHILEHLEHFFVLIWEPRWSVICAILLQLHISLWRVIYLIFAVTYISVIYFYVIAFFYHKYLDVSWTESRRFCVRVLVRVRVCMWNG